MHPCPAGGSTPMLSTTEFYRDALQALDGAGVPFLVGGAFAFERYARIARPTKDLDIFIHPRDVSQSLALLSARGYRTEVPFPHWLAKAWSGDALLDLIFSSGNGIVVVDDEWFDNAPGGEVLGLPVKLTPVEEMIWSKAFVIERERCDAADVAHLLLQAAAWLDWERLLARFGARWRVLFAHLVLFGFIYPSERTVIPATIMRELWERAARELETDDEEMVCNGTVLSRAQYLVDVERWGFEDGRLAPRGGMTPSEVARWTAAIDHAK